MFYLTSHDARRVRHGGWDASDRSFDQQHFENQPDVFWFKGYGSKGGFHVFGDLYPCSIFCRPHWTFCTGISMRICPVLMSING